MKLFLCLLLLSGCYQTKAPKKLKHDWTKYLNPDPNLIDCHTVDDLDGGFLFVCTERQT